VTHEVADPKERGSAGLGIPLGIQRPTLESARVNSERTDGGQSFASSGVITTSVHLLIRWSQVRILPGAPPKPAGQTQAGPRLPPADSPRV
jgi:hypothetical protein